MARKRKKKASAKQIAARKRFAAMAKSGAFRKKSHAAPKRKVKRRRHARRKSLLSSKGRHRPVVHVRKGRLYRPRRSSIPSRATFANPFLGELAVIGGNPMKRRKKSHKRTHRRSRRLHRNPGAALIARPLSALTAGPREMIKVGFLQEAASVAVGFVAPNLLLPMLPLWARDARWKVYASKAVLVGAVASAAGAVTSKRVRDAILLGGGVSILLDAWADFVAPAVGGPSLREDMGAYYGEPTNEGVAAYYGEPTNAGLADGGDLFGGPSY